MVDTAQNMNGARVGNGSTEVCALMGSKGGVALCEEVEVVPIYISMSGADRYRDAQ